MNEDTEKIEKNQQKTLSTLADLRQGKIQTNFEKSADNANNADNLVNTENKIGGIGKIGNRLDPLNNISFSTLKRFGKEAKPIYEVELEHFPQEIRDYIDELSKELSASKNMIALMCLVAISTAVSYTHLTLPTKRIV